MKTPTFGTIAALQSGTFAKADLYAFALAIPASATIDLTSWDSPLKVSGTTYSNGVTLKRGAWTNGVGIDAKTMKLEVTPAPDSPTQISLAGANFLQACRLGYLDNAVVTWSKLFMPTPLTGTAADVTNGVLIPWATFIVTDVQATRFTATLQLSDPTDVLTIQMPRNLFQASCLHAFGDAGCNVSGGRAAYTFTGTVSETGTSLNQFTTTSLTQDSSGTLESLAASTNIGSGSISSVTVLSSTNPNLLSPVTLTFLTGSTYSINGGGSYSYTSGGNIDINGWQVQISGAPAVGDSFSVKASDYFAQGILTWTSGANTGLYQDVQSYLHGSPSVITTQAPFPNIPQSGDAFSISAGCDRQQSTCSSKFSNLAHFRGFPYIPVPETLYDGGTSNPTLPAVGVQGTPVAGSGPSSILYPGSYP